MADIYRSTDQYATLPGVRAGRAGWRQLTTVLALAFALRAGVLWKNGGALAEDRDNYRRIAQHLAAGDGFVDPQTLKPTAYRPPLFPVLLAGVLLCGGGATAIGIVQLLLGVATVALTVSCGRRLGLGRASLAAGLFVAVDPLLLYQTALVMTETTAAFLAALLMWLSLAPRSPKKNFCEGIVLGLACLCRPTFWAFGGLSAAIWGFRFLRRYSRSQVWHREYHIAEAALDCPQPLGTPTRSASEGVKSFPRWRFGLVWDASLLAAGSIVAGLLLVVAPWVIRNAVVMGRPIVTTTHGGYTLLLAHNPAYTRAVVEQPRGAVWEGEQQANWVAAIEAEMARENPPIDASQLSPAVELARDAWMSQTAWKYIGEQPIVAFRAGWTLLGRMWNVVPLATDRTTRSAAVRLAIGTFYSGLFLAVLVGVARNNRTDWFAWRPVLVLIVSFTAVHSIYWADMRMRTPLVPALALLAAAGFSASSRLNNEPRQRRTGFQPVRSQS